MSEIIGYMVETVDDSFVSSLSTKEKDLLTVIDDSVEAHNTWNKRRIKIEPKFVKYKSISQMVAEANNSSDDYVVVNS